MTKRNKKLTIIFSLSIIILIGFLIPERLIIPVKNATSRDWNHKTFWQYPWGKSVIHTGIDIFAKRENPVVSASIGIILYKGNFGRGGKSIFVLGHKWKIHYYAHLNSYTSGLFSIVKKGEEIGKVGNTGNAKNTPSHLHYSIITLIPYPWRWDSARRGYLKIFFLDPSRQLLE